jgi:hypothetical protein
MMKKAEDEFEEIMMSYAENLRAEGDSAGADSILDGFQVRRQWHEAKEKQRLAESTLLEARADLEALNRKLEVLDLRQARLDAEAFEASCLNMAGYEHQRNPLFLWGEILISDKTKPLPAWVRNYLDDVANELFSCSADPIVSPKQCLRGLPVILGLSRHGWNAFEDIRSFEAAAQAATKLDAADGKRENAVADLARALGKSPSTIFRWARSVRQTTERAIALRYSRKPPSK